ncbi:44800_t:CDS:2, partial [Gigaspora margarita]
ACMDMVEKEIALQDKNMKITNTLCYCASYLKNSISHIDEDKEEDSISTISTHSLESFLKKQLILSQYIIQTTIKDLACNDKISITIASNSWHNVQKEKVIIRICNLFEEIKKLNIRANCLVTDSAGLYAAARHYLKNEMRNKANCYIGNIFKESVMLKNTNDIALNNDLTLPNKIKVTVNHDSF